MASYDDALAKMFEDRLTAFYKHYDEAKVASVPTLLAKYKGKEEQLLAAVVKKYGPEPEPDDDDDDDDGDEAATDEEAEAEARGVAPGKDAAPDGDEDLEGEPEAEPESDGEDKVPVYCALGLGLPPEYVEFDPDYDKCAEWIKKHCPHLLTDAGDDGDDDGDGKKKSRKRGGGVVKKKVLAEDKQKVIISKEVRNKKKAVTTVEGLETFGVKLKDAAKVFGKKFAASSSVKGKDTGGEEIVIQGDVIWDLPALLEKEYKIPKAKIWEKEKGGKLTKVR